MLTKLVIHQSNIAYSFWFKDHFKDNITNTQDLNINKTQNYGPRMVGMDASSTNIHALVADYTPAYTVLHVFLSKAMYAET